MDKIRVLLADDHLLFSKLMNTFLSNKDDIEIVASARNGKEALSFLDQHEVDVALLDIDMPEKNGIETLLEIKENHPGIQVIILSSHEEANVIQKTLNKGALGYLTKSAEEDEVLEAIRTVHRGATYCSKISLQSIVNNMSHKEEPEVFHDGINDLTAREKEILQLISDEYTNAEIADMLCISSRTVETHRKNIFSKLNVKNTAGLIKVAIQANLIQP